MSPKIIKLAQDVLKVEATEILKASDKISNEFSDAVEYILYCEGRVILSGIGKSGHIAGKIASTLSSTGTPSFFMHPGEASHGDLGMITDKDIVIFLSNSGESQELILLIPLIKRIGAKIISITGDTNSTLSNESNIHINSQLHKRHALWVLRQQLVHP
jgi:arabinose-5-phosphate isomerase